MKRTAWLVFFLTLICIRPGFNQTPGTGDGRIIFRGIVRDASTLESLANTQVFINKLFITLSDSTGSFVVRAYRGDTLVFRHLGYQLTYLHATDTLAGREFLTGVYMKSDTLSIGEVIIMPRLLNLRSEVLKSPLPPRPEVDNARYNIAISAYQGKMAINKLGDPLSNYSVIHHQMKIEAFEKGTIPSGRTMALSPFSLVGVMYLLINGLPDKPEVMKAGLTTRELQQIHQAYLKSKQATDTSSIDRATDFP